MPSSQVRSGGTVQLNIVPERKIQLKLIYSRVADLHFDIKNPRLRHLGQLRSEDDVETFLWKEPSTRTLFREIEYTQGLSAPLLINEDGTVREGNRRLVCLRKLISKIRDGNSDIPLFKIDRVPCYVLPRNTPEEDIALYLTLEHVTGKKEWRPINQAAHVYDLHNVYGLSFSQISTTIGRPQSYIKLMERAYTATLRYHALFPFDNAWMGKYSYFLEAYKSQQTSHWLSIEGNLERLMKWIETGRISKGREVRNLQLIINNVDKKNGNGLIIDQDKSNKQLFLLNTHSDEILAQLIELKKHGKLTNDALATVKKLQIELTKYIDNKSNEPTKTD